MPSRRRYDIWRFLGPLAAPLLLLTLVFTLWEPINGWLQGHRLYDQEVLREWIQEAQVDQTTLRGLVKDYLQTREDYEHLEKDVLKKFRRQKVAEARTHPYGIGKSKPAPNSSQVVAAVKDRKENTAIASATKTAPEIASPESIAAGKALLRFSWELGNAKTKVVEKKGELQYFLQSLAEPITKDNRNQTLLFPVIYRIEVALKPNSPQPIAWWDSALPRKKEQFEKFYHSLDIDEDTTAYVYVEYHFRLYNSWQDNVRQKAERSVYFSSLLTLVATLVLFWVYFAWSRARQRQWREMVAEQQVNEAQRKHLEEELARKEAVRKHQEAERANLELKSQLWANISILAGSYAHNIKNLLVRPNDLLSRCLETDAIHGNQGRMLKEVRETLGTVTERLQQILQTVRRDPTQIKRERLDLNLILDDLRQTWQELAREKWQLTISLDLTPDSLWIEGDPSNLQQAVENLLFNARDATFEMRNYLREQARRNQDNGADKNAPKQRRQALIAAANWKGEAVLRGYMDKEHVVLEVRDNGIGMSEEVRARCTETHFTTKRNSALYAGFSSGMGLGLSFLQVILEQHRATLTVDSEPLQGTTFRIRFPACEYGLALIREDR